MKTNTASASLFLIAIVGGLAIASCAPAPAYAKGGDRGGPGAPEIQIAVFVDGIPVRESQVRRPSQFVCEVTKGPAKGKTVACPAAGIQLRSGK